MIFSSALGRWSSSSCTFSSPPLYNRDGQLQVAGNLVEVGAFRVRKANPLVQHGVVLHEVDVREVELVHSMTSSLKNPLFKTLICNLLS
jgi:hypothetical protein